MRSDPTPIQNPKNFGPWSVGQKCQVAELPGTWVIDYFNIFDANGPHEFEQVHANKLKRDGSRAKYNCTVRASQLIPLDGKQPTTDKDGLTALQSATAVFSNGFAKHGWYNTDKETLVKVDSISKSGRVKVQDINIKKGITPRHKTVDGHKIYEQEYSLVNFASLEYELRGETQTFSPSLHNGEWTWWKGGEVIEAPAMRLTWLND